jgi:hypothetical protein
MTGIRAEKQRRDGFHYLSIAAYAFWGPVVVRVAAELVALVR